MDSSQAPLIAGHGDEEEELEYDSAQGSPIEAGKTGSGMPSVFVLALTFAAGISGLLFGCMYLLCVILLEFVLTRTCR